jgi:hypothetical protein
LLICGRPDTFGSFTSYADDLITADIIKRVPRKNTRVLSVLTKHEFLDEIAAFAKMFLISELHVFSHSYGAALSLGYHDRAQGLLRGQAIDRYLRVGQKTPLTALLDAEVGMLFTDDLVRGQYAANKATIRRFFHSSATIKLWGCNSGIDGWTFSDPLSDPALPGAWLDNDKFKKTVGRWPTQKDILRLKPDKGDYKKYMPK